jgi:cell division protein FtsL
VSRARTSARAAVTFRATILCLLVLITAGMARVTLAAQAAEASIDAWELKQELRVEQQLARTLEADRSSLAAHSRIEDLACESLNMDRPAQVCYLELPGAQQPSAAVVADAAGSAAAPAGDASPALETARSGFITTLAHLAAGEAQALLVGNMGLGSIR